MANTRRAAHVHSTQHHDKAKDADSCIWSYPSPDARSGVLWGRCVLRTLSRMEEMEFGDLNANLSEEAWKIAAENLDRYLELAWEIFEDVQTRERDNLTGSESNPTMQGKVDSSIN